MSSNNVGQLIANTILTKHKNNNKGSRIQKGLDS